MFFAEELLWEFQISIQTMAISDLGKALIIYGLEANDTSLKDFLENTFNEIRSNDAITH